jgi:peptidoglycan hydrolase-like protein with peptidoglycan-binding domain
MRSFTHLAAALLVGAAVSVGAEASHSQTVELTYAQPLSTGGVQMVQQRLRQIGDYSGGVDGVWGPDSVTALERFQQTHGLQPTGQLNQATVASLGLDSATLLGTPTVAAAVPPPAVPAPPRYQPMLSVHGVQLVQERLRGLGYYGGAIDGVWGAATQDAIGRFQQGRALQPSGQFNPATAAALGLNPNSLYAAR